jgi:hypothetical protein
MGRPSEFSQATADAICERIAEGRSLRKICLDDDMPATSSVFKWLGLHPDFAEQYARAREAQADTMADEILDISDDGKNDTYIDKDGVERTDTDVIARSKLRVDSRKWLASKMAPKKYGEKLDLNHGGQPNNPITGIQIEIIKANG